MSRANVVPRSRSARVLDRIRRIVYSRWVGIAVVVALVTGTIVWFLTRTGLPPVIRVAAGNSDGQYYRYAYVLGKDLAVRTGREVEVLETEGSLDNAERVLEGRAELAIIQNGAIPMKGLVAIAPVFEDVVHVVVRVGEGIETVNDLSGKGVALGEPGSGMLKSSEKILKHYGIENDGQHKHRYFMELLNEDTTLDAAIVTTGFVNGHLQTLLATGDFELLGIHAEAVAFHHAYWSTTTIPRGLYREGDRPVPARDISTVGTTAVFVAAEDAEAELVEALVETLFEGYRWNGVDPDDELTVLMTADEARRWTGLPLHERTRRYLEPYRGLGYVKDFVEQLAAMKELLFALGAGVYFLWLWQRRRKHLAARERLAAQRRRLNAFLDETTQIESAQMVTEDPKQLREYMDAVTRIKLRALEELTGEDLRGDQLFSIFLIQCSNLMRKIQMKISMRTR